MKKSDKEVNNNRIVWIDYLKAFACFLVIFGHLIQSLTKAGIDPIPGITNFINHFIYYFHMPLFMGISGYLYIKTKKEFTWKKYKEFEVKKIINLLVPYITFYLIFMLLNVMFASNVNSSKGIKELLGIFNNPIPPYWYLYALTSIFIIVPLLEKVFKNNTNMVLSFFFIIKAISIFWTPKIYILSSIMCWGLYFYFGSLFDKINFDKKALSMLFLLGYTILSFVVFKYTDSINSYLYKFINIILAVLGIVIFVILFKKMKSNKVLDTFKNYTFEIFLTHTIFAACFRIILMKIGIVNYIVHLILGIIVSIYIPVIMSIVSKKLKYTEFFFYPIKTYKSIKSSKN